MGPRAGEHEGRMGPRAGEHKGRMGPRAGGFRPKSGTLIGAIAAGGAGAARAGGGALGK